MFFKSQIGQENPEFLIAHAYTRYLGDLSGGQVLGRIAQKSMGLKGSEGLSFFAFPGVTSPNLFKQLYRSRMNSVELTEEERNGVLEEAVRAFELNIEVRSKGCFFCWWHVFVTRRVIRITSLSRRSSMIYRKW